MINQLRTFEIRSGNILIVIREPIIADLELIYQVNELNSPLEKVFYMLGKFLYSLKIPP